MWVLFAVLSAFGTSTSDLFAKDAMRRGVPERPIIWLRYAFALPALIPIAFFIRIPGLDQTFWRLHLIWLPLETLALLLYIRAIRISPLSLTLPFLALTPAFVIPVAYLVLGETPGPLAVLGIALIVLGSYVLNAEKSRRGLWAPLRAAVRERGSLLMIGVAAIYGVTSVTGKMLVLHSSPMFYSVYHGLVMTLVLSPLLLFDRGRPRFPRGARSRVVLSGLFFALMIVGHMLAVSLAHVAYMIAMKRLSGLFGAVYGGLYFREERPGPRIAGAALMVLGAVLVSL
jgi:drug/metabolite transporter (DMT)-like permease